MATFLDPDQTAPIGAVCSGFMLFASILNYLHQKTSAHIFKFIFGALRVNTVDSEAAWKNSADPDQTEK